MNEKIADMLDRHKQAKEDAKLRHESVLENIDGWYSQVKDIDTVNMQAYKSIGCIDRNHYSAYKKEMKKFKKTLERCVENMDLLHSLEYPYMPSRSKKLGNTVAAGALITAAVPILVADAITSVTVVKPVLTAFYFEMIDTENDYNEADMIVPSYHPFKKRIKARLDKAKAASAYTNLLKRANILYGVLDNLETRMQGSADQKKMAKAIIRHGNDLDIMCDQAKEDVANTLNILYEIKKIHGYEDKTKVWVK